MHKEICVTFKKSKLILSGIIFVVANIVLNCIFIPNLILQGYNLLESMVCSVAVNLAITFFIYLIILIIYTKIKGKVINRVD